MWEINYKIPSYMWWADGSTYSVPYDGRSIMHYGPKSGAKPKYKRQYTMISRVSFDKLNFLKI